MTQVELDNLVSYWQGMLRLRDWDVKINLVRGRDLDQNTGGNCEWVLKRRTALIKILDPIDYPPEIQWPQDIEETIVHELLHLHFAPFDHTTDDADDIAREQAISMIASGFVGLRRSSATSKL